MSNKTAEIGYPRILYPSIEAAQQATPYFLVEDGVGPWLCPIPLRQFTVDECVIYSGRYALHIPSLEQNGTAVAESLIAKLCQQAIRIGLDQTCLATGYWTNRATGLLQVESIKIMCTDNPISFQLLRQLAQEVLWQTDQEGVSIEIAGRVEQHFRL